MDSIGTISPHSLFIRECRLSPALLRPSSVGYLSIPTLALASNLLLVLRSYFRDEYHVFLGLSKLSNFRMIPRCRWVLFHSVLIFLVNIIVMFLVFFLPSSPFRSSSPIHPSLNFITISLLLPTLSLPRRKQLRPKHQHRRHNGQRIHRPASAMLMSKPGIQYRMELFTYQTIMVDA